MKKLVVGALAVLSLACGKEEKKEESSAAAVPAATPGAAATPAPGGNVIVIEAISDEKGNYFSPNQLEAHKGDVLRFTLKVGVHNVHFLPDSNAIKTGLPPASEMLQLPGQTYDVPVNFAEGTYYFQCDPHAALGMHGRVKVED